MPGFRNVAAFAEAVDAGSTSYSIWRKSPSQVTVAGVWFDLSMSPGLPVPNYYASAPLAAAVVEGSGIFHGADVSPRTKRLKSLMAMTAVATALPMNLILCDYLLYYPFLDMGTNDEQLLTNAVSLPRYTDGKGVQVMAVMTNPQVAGGTTFSFDYTNQDGVAGKTSATVTCNTATAAGSLINTAPATAGASSPFIPLAPGDTGVRSIDKFRMVAGTDVGLICLVMVKPIARLMLRGIDAPCEVDFATDFPSLPEVRGNAYLNFLALPNGSLAATPLHGSAEFIWS